MTVVAAFDDQVRRLHELAEAGLAAARRLGLTRAQLAYRLRQADAPEQRGQGPADVQKP